MPPRATKPRTKKVAKRGSEASGQANLPFEEEEVPVRPLAKRSAAVVHHPTEPRPDGPFETRVAVSTEAKAKPRRRAAAGASRAAAPARLAAEAPADPGPRLRAWVDGGARGNPGPAGYGAHIEDADGRTVRDASGFLGTTTNNIAEYNGLLAALRTAIELNASALEVFADSELIVKQMNGVYKVKNEGLRPLFIAAQQLASSLPRFRISHVRRENNKDADRLANEAMDRGA